MEYKPDIHKVIERYIAFWQRDIYDRPPIRIRYPIPGQSDEEWTAACQTPETYYAYHENVFKHRVNLWDDALPSATVDMGPGFMGGVMGCKVRFEHGTSWSEHCLEDWSDLDLFSCVDIDETNPWVRTLKGMIEYFSKKSQGKCVVGLAGIQIVSDYPAGPTLKEILPLLKKIQKNHCLLLRKYPMTEIEDILPELAPQGLYVDTQCDSLEDAQKILNQWSNKNW